MKNKTITLLTLTFLSVLAYHPAKAADNTNEVMFVYQATAGSWSDPRLANGCEEAAILMARSWYRGVSMSEEDKRNQIIAMSEYESRRFGYFEDTSAADTAALAKEYYNLPTTLRYNINVEDIKKSLSAGNIVIVPINGQALNNPRYVKPGPPRHTIVVTGYDSQTDRFTIDDPGTRYGNGQVFAAGQLQRALQDYETGPGLKVMNARTAMIEVAQDRIGLQ